MAATFIFGADGLPKTPQEAARLRAIAQAMAPQGAPKNVGEGLTSLGNAIAYRMMMNKAAKGDDMGRNTAASDFAALMPSFGSAAAPPAPSVSNAAPTPSMAPTPKNQPPIPGIQPSNQFDGSLKGGIEATAKSLGIDPIDLATAISYETAGTFDPTKAGPTTQWGQHRGLIQFGEPQAKEYGVNWDDPIGSQLGPDGAIAKYLRSTGVKPGMGLMDIYSAINAGGVGRYGASDANNGGAPGTVADKVNNQMAGHRTKALAMFGGQQPTDAAGAVTTMGQGGQMPMPEASAYVDPMVSAPNSRKPVADALAKTQPPVQVAQAAPARRGIVDAIIGRPQQTQDMPTDYFPAAPSALGTSGPSPQQIMQVLTNPYASPEQKAIAQDMYQQMQQSRDPMRQLEMQKMQLELQQMQNPQANIPDSVRALELRAKAAGLRPGTKEYSDFMLSGGDKGITVDARQMGNIPPGYKADYDANGNVISLSPIPGSPADVEAKAAQEKKALGQNMQAGKADVVTQDIDRAIAVMESGTLPDTGAGALLSSIPGTDAKRLSGLLDTVKANVSFDTLNQMRQASPTGGALGSVTENELKLLQSAIGSLDQSQDAATLKDNLNRVWNMYQDTVHGPGNGPPRRPLSFDTQAPKADETPPPAGMDKELWDVMTPEERALWK